MTQPIRVPGADRTFGQEMTLAELKALANRKPTKAIIYIRVSSLREERKEQGEITTATQDRYCREYAKREGIEIVDVLSDLNKSGRKEKFLDRKVMAIIERVRQGEADCVIVYNLSRWGRAGIENKISEMELFDAGGLLLSATEPNDNNTPAGRFTRTQLYALAELQSDQIGQSWRAAHESRWNNQLPHHGRPRLGYIYIRHGVGNAEYQLDPVTSDLLAGAYRSYTAGNETLMAITRRLAKLGVTNPGTNLPITYMVLRNQLDSGFGAGKIVRKTRKGEQRVFLPGGHPPVITQKEWEAYQKRRTSQDAKKAARPKNPRIALQGLVMCGSCHRPMQISRSNGVIKYQCTNKTKAIVSTRPPCEHPTGIRAAIVDEAVQQWLRDFTKDMTKMHVAQLERAQAATIATANVEALKHQLAGQKSARKQYLRLRATNTIETDEELAEMLAEVDAKIKEVDAALDEASVSMDIHAMPAQDVIPALLYGWLSGMNEERVNDAAREIIKGIYIGNGKSASSPDKIDIIGSWERREPDVWIGDVRNVDHDKGKNCSRCLKFKPADDFYRRKSGRDAGKLSSWCRGCQSGYYQLEWFPGTGTKADPNAKRKAKAR